jgi:hypothetical protein
MDRQEHLMKAYRACLFLNGAAAYLAASLLWLGATRADEVKRGDKNAIDSEHIFGFTEGSDIGEKGEIELESSNVVRFGRSYGYTATDHETAVRYVVADKFRASIGGLLDYRNVSRTPDDPHRADFGFGGVTSEFRWHPIERTAQSPFGVTLSLAPEWTRIDDVGAPSETYAIPLELLVDAAVIPGKLFTALNLVWEPEFKRTANGWGHENDFEISAAAAYAVTPDLLIGGELRHLSFVEQGGESAEALFAGPSVYYRLSDTVSIKGAWSFQLPDESTGRLDLEHFERHQALLFLVKGL